MKTDLPTMLKLSGLPEPQKEILFHPSRLFRWDWGWTEIKLAIEIQGGTWNRGGHVRGARYAIDCEKLNEGQLLGWMVLWFTTQMVDKGAATGVIKQAFERRTLCGNT